MDVPTIEFTHHFFLCSMSGIDIWTCSLRASQPAPTRGSEHRISLLLVCGNSETALVTATFVMSKAASITCGKATNAEGYLHPFCVNNFVTSGLQQVLQQLWPVVIMKALWTHDVRVCEMQVRGLIQHCCCRDCYTCRDGCQIIPWMPGSARGPGWV